MSEHEDGGMNCSWYALRTPVKHMVNATFTGSGGFAEGRDSKAEYAKWSAEEANSDPRPVANLGDAAFCAMDPGGQGPRAGLVILAGERLLFVNAVEDADNTCDTLKKFANLALGKMRSR
ncbi:hypothetical protein ACFXHA_40935 [Nocardia sp. NPDC059240]|uniref:hypothetical protein n=1 Tax=Nocardia sp. NPDC059240 TaxID=3346786 RepID=UPI00369B33D9